MEIEEYIRTNNGVIRKIKLIRKDKVDVDEVYRRYGYLTETVRNDNIVKHSKNIIDLIQCGDYVNGMRVIATENRGRYNEEKQKDEKVILAENYDEWTENGVISNEDIKTILTKEQYEQYSYKIGE